MEMLAAGNSLLAYSNKDNRTIVLRRKQGATGFDIKYRDGPYWLWLDERGTYEEAVALADDKDTVDALKKQRLEEEKEEKEAKANKLSTGVRALSRGSSLTSVSESLQSLALEEEEDRVKMAVPVAAAQEVKIQEATAPARYSRPWMEHNLWEAADRVGGLKEGWAKERGIEILAAYGSRPSYLQSWEAENHAEITKLLNAARPPCPPDWVNPVADSDSSRGDSSSDEDGEVADGGGFD